MSKRNILLVNDIVGYGKLAASAMLPIFSYMGHPTYSLPTLLISNAFQYGYFNQLDTTDYIQGVLPVWKRLGVSFDAIVTGFIPSARQARIIADFCREQAEKQGATIFVDPVMGDEGSLYTGVDAEVVERMREMVSVSHLTMPNYTEACYLTDTPYNAQGISEEESRRLLDGMRRIGARSVVITSCNTSEGAAVAGYNHMDDSYFLLPYTEIPVQFPGTGDIFASVLISHLLDGKSLRESTQLSMDAVYQLIDRNKEQEDKNCGIPLERCFDVLKDA